MTEALIQALKDFCGWEGFRPGQAETLEALLAGKNTLAILPTGSGKSLCYQLYGHLTTGTVVVISPLLSLMEDQVRQLQKLGERRVIALNSTLSFTEKRYVCQHLQAYKYIFVSPEMLWQPAVLQAFQQLEISLFVVDEAHCIAQWGADFRPDYLQLNGLWQALKQPLTLALTATATPAVKEEIFQQLFASMTSYEEVVLSMDRENIALFVDETSDKQAQLAYYLEKLPRQGIVYCATRQTAEELHEWLTATSKKKSAFYHGGLTGQERHVLQTQFIENQLDLLFATNAFGMGIDKSDIRFVIHYDCPDSLENYVQEIGRAGRDGAPSLAILLYQTGDERIHWHFQKQTRTQRQTLEAWLKLEQEQLADARVDLQQEELVSKWLAGVQRQQYTIEELQALLQQKEQQRRQQLAFLLDYIQTPTCRRQFIRTYFGEKITTEPNCQGAVCDRCAGNFDTTVTQLTFKEAVITASLDWQQKLMTLFRQKS